MQYNNTLTAKEWLEKEGYNFTVETNTDVYATTFMEKYANYKNKILEDRIAEFRQHLVLKIVPYTDSPIERWYLEQYDKHFNIENKQ